MMKRLFIFWLALGGLAFGQTSTTTTLTPSTTTPAYLSNVTFTMSVSPSAATGTVSLYIGPTIPTSNGTLEGTATLSGGTATFVLNGSPGPPFNQTLMGGGPNLFVAVYSGDSTYAASTSSVLTLNMQPISAVELMGTTTANQAVNGLGFNLDDQEDWEFGALAAAGAKWARFQCSWDIVEQQTPPPNNNPGSPQYVQDPNCTSGYASAASRGIHATTVAAYDAPWHKILTVTVPAGASVGTNSFVIQFSSGVGGDTLSNIIPITDYLQSNVNGANLTNQHGYPGSLVTGVSLIDSTHATLTLASNLSAALPADGTTYSINEILYQPTATASATDTSNVAYGNYVRFLASNMNANGVSGDVEIWNECPWASSNWDFREGLYAPGTFPGTPQYGCNFGFVANIQASTLASGVTATWNGTSGNGAASILGPLMLQYSGVPANQPATVVSRDSYHPYGDRPEEIMFDMACLLATVPYFGTYPNGESQNCLLPGESASANFSEGVQFDLVAKATSPSYGVGRSVTETGITPPVSGQEVQQANFVLRQFIGFSALGVSPVEFFKLCVDGTQDPSFGFVIPTGGSSTCETATGYTPKPSFTALQGFEQDLAPIGNAPVAAYPPITLPSVFSYGPGTYPLTSAHFVGATAGATANSDAFIVYQRSNSTIANNWVNLTTAPAPISIAIPFGLAVTSVRNLVTRATVTYTTSGSTISFQVADQPIEIIVEPNSFTGPGQTFTGGKLSGGAIGPT